MNYNNSEEVMKEMAMAKELIGMRMVDDFKEDDYE